MEGNIWYHGSPFLFEVLEAGSTVTPWRKLAEAFSHKPDILCIEDDGEILHNGKGEGFLYRIAEPFAVGEDLFPHPRSTMEEKLEFLTKRPLRVELIGKIPPLGEEFQKRSARLIASHQKKKA